jgi:hypothetical protein
MKLPDLLRTVEKSSLEQWDKVDSPTLYKLEESERGQYCPNMFDTVFVFEEDVDISIVMAATIGRQFPHDDIEAAMQNRVAESWATSFPNGNAKLVVVALRYRGVIVHEWSCVIVDGGRHLMPLPHRKGVDAFEMATAKLPMARLLFNLFEPVRGHTSLEDALRYAGVQIVEEESEHGVVVQS